MKNKNRFEGFVTKLFILCLITGFATVAAPLFSADAQTVTIPDANLRTALESALNKAAGADITEAELSGLRQLDARNSSITTLTGLEKATGLRSLNLKGNSVSDISPVVSLPRLRLLNVENNPLNYASLYTHIPAIERAMADRNNASVTYTARIPTTLTKVSGDSQTGELSATLANSFVVEVKDGANPAAVFAGVPVTFAVTAGGGTLSATSATTNASGRAETTLTLGSTAGANTVTASVTHAGTTVSVTFTATAESPSAPTFTSGTTFSVAENSTAVGTVTASDADTQDSVTGYTITGGADSAEFSITDAGVLTFDAAPDYEFPGDATTNNEYTIVVTVTSGAGARALTATQTLTITVTDVDEAPGKPDAPAVTGADATPTELSVSWNAPTNTGPTINDYDVQYRAGTSGAFTDADFTGIVTSTTLTGLTTGTSYQVQVRATNDEGTGSWSDAGTGTTATNVAPVFSSSTTAFSVSENSTSVTTATATDADASDTTVTYALSGADSAAFSISTSGELTFSTAPDYENPTDVQSTAPANAASNREYIVIITATSGIPARQLSVSKTLTITVTDVDEAPGKPDAPTVNASHATPTELSVSWTAPTNTGPAITDYDVRYRKGTTGNFTDADYTGTATSMTLTGLIAGTNYQVQVRATNDEDTGPWSDAGSRNTAQNAAPTFNGEATTFSVAENSTFITTATARDADVRDTPVTYALSGTDSAAFSILTNSGRLSFSTAPDYENPTDAESTTPASAASNNEYVVTITATSGAAARALSTSMTLFITVTDVDEPPAKPDAPTVTGADATPTELSVRWTAPTNTGPAITDYDVRYRKGTTGNFTDADYTGTTTSMTLTGLTAGTSYQVQVQATNDEGTGAWSDIGIGTTATNAAPAFTNNTTKFSVDENSTAVTTATATDADASDYDVDPSDSVTYTLSGADSAKFSISTSGALTFSTAPDFENPTDVQSITPANVASNNEYIVTITATSGTSARQLSVSKTLTITVTNVDEPPAKPAAPTVAPHVITSQLTITWTAPENTGKPAITGYKIRYRKGTRGTFTEKTETVTGTSTTLTGLTMGTPYQVQVRAINNEGNSPWSDTGIGTTAVNVAPTFTTEHTYPVAENTKAVGTVIATDADPQDEITGYEITGGADKSKFTITVTNRVATLSFKDAPDYERPGDVVSTDPVDNAGNNLYIVAITAKSGTGVRELSEIHVLNITVIDVDEAPGKPDAPAVTGANATPTELSVSWTEPSNTGPEITDYDVQYRSGTRGTFTDFAHTGTSLTTTLTGLRAGTPYQVQVRATNDEDTGPWSDAGIGTTAVNVAPTFSSPATFSPAENTTAVGTVVATDADTQDEITGYEITGGADKSKFAITNTGVLTFTAAPDYETPGDVDSTIPANAADNNEYVLFVTAKSGTGARQLSSLQVLTVTVTDVNEPPDKPDAPTVTETLHNSLTVGWKEPKNTSKPEVEDYDVQYREGTTGTFKDGPQTVTAKTATITGLKPNTSYQVRVRATNVEGTGPWSDAGTGKTDYQPEDVNRDDEVNVADLIAIGNHIGGTTNTAHEPDVNKDGTVNSADSQLVIRVALNNSNALTDIDGDDDVDVEDLVAFAATPVDVNGDTKTDDDDIKLIARLALNAAANRDAAPAPSQTHATLNAQNLQHLVHQALQSNRFDATYRRGVAALERILESLMIPEESALLHNYPNPFNPETWVPYQLASPAEVTLTLYDVTGRIVRTLNLGHQDAGMYRSKSRAAYWDGRNAQGEPVASGVYFYTLVAGEFTATGKMLIRK